MEHHSSTTVALPPPKNNKKHDIFLSHSGQQKGFARDLCSRLCSRGYSVFFDENDDSLPPGEEFPPFIFSAANTCDLALVVISDDFLRSKWPMMELCALVDRLQSHRSPDAPHFTILPLFFKLSPAAIKDERNIEEWRKEWETFEQIRKERITAAKCEKAVTKVLSSLNGVVRGPESQQGESSYIDDVVDRISSIVHPRNLLRFREGVDPQGQQVGRERLCQLILEEFRKLEDEHDPSSSQVSILGMYGVPGSGKSTLCDFLRESMFDEFGGNVIYLKLPTELREGDDLLVKEQYVKLLSMLIPHIKRDFASMDLDQLYNQLYTLGASLDSHKMFVVMDNISPSNCERYKAMVKAVVSSGILGAGSRVMLVAQTKAILENVFMEVKDMYSHTYGSTQVPSLTEEEAMELIRNRYPSVTDDVLTHLLQKCSFPFSSFMYIPFVFEQIGILLRDTDCTKVKELEILWKTVEEGKKDAIKMLVDINLKQLPEDLRVLFFDIALYIIPAGYSKLSDATPILSRMHRINNTFNDMEQKLRMIKDMGSKIKELQKYCVLSVSEDALRVHDIFTEYARSIPGNSNRYVNRPSLNISHLLVINDPNCPSPTHPRPTEINLKCLEARTICIGIGKGSPYCCNDDEEVHLHLEVGAAAQVVHVRNLSHYSKFILGLAGHLSSLVCLRTENVQQVLFSRSISSPGSDAILSNLLRLELRNHKSSEDKFEEMSLSGLKRKRMGSSFDFVSHKLQKTVESMARWLWKPFILSHEQTECLSGSYNQPMSTFVFTRRMPWLRVLILINVHLGRLEIASQYYCPELELLEVQNNPEEPMDVSICDAPKLRKLVTGDVRYYHGRNYFRSLFRHPISRNPRKLVLQIRKCPELREVDVDGSFDQVRIVGLLPSKLRELSLANDRRDEFIPLNLIRSSMHQLSQLEALRLSECRGIENMEFTQEYLPCLKTMVVRWCASLARLCIGPGCMPNLVELDVSFCDKLQVIEGFEDLLMQRQQLKSLSLYYLSQLRCERDVMRLGGSCGSSQLERIHVHGCPNVRIHFNVLEASENLSSIAISDGVSIEKCKQSADDAIRISDASKTITMQEEDCDPDLQSSSVSSTIYRMPFVKGRFTHLWRLELSDLDHLREIEGIQHLPQLVWFHMGDLANLSRVSETWPRSIQSIRFYRCPMLLEMPRLERILELFHFGCRDCPRLKAVEGEITMTRWTWVEFSECESMEVLPIWMEQQVMGEWGKRRRDENPENWWGSNPLSVYGSKFATAEAMRSWLLDEDTEWGSPVFEAAVQALVWEHVVKGDSSAMDTLRDYFSARADAISEKKEDLQYLRNLFVECGSSLFSWPWPYDYHKKQSFPEWILQIIPPLSTDSTPFT